MMRLALKHKTHFSSPRQSVHLQHSNAFIMYLECGLETLEEVRKLGKKVSVKLNFI